MLKNRSVEGDANFHCISHRIGITQSGWLNVPVRLTEIFVHFGAPIPLRPEIRGRLRSGGATGVAGLRPRIRQRREGRQRARANQHRGDGTCAKWQVVDDRWPIRGNERAARRLLSGRGRPSKPAFAMAARIPAARFGCVELRPIMKFS
jgi:hypothetical protein